MVITDEQTLVNKNSRQPDDHILTPENSIKPLVVSQQPLLTRLSKGNKSQTDCSSSSSPISDIGNEIGVLNYHPASNDLASSQYEFWNDYDQADLDVFDEIDAQYALRKLYLSNPTKAHSQKHPKPFRRIDSSIRNSDIRTNLVLDRYTFNKPHLTPQGYQPTESSIEIFSTYRILSLSSNPLQNPCLTSHLLSHLSDPTFTTQSLRKGHCHLYPPTRLLRLATYLSGFYQSAHPTSFTGSNQSDSNTQNLNKQALPSPKPLEPKRINTDNGFELSIKNLPVQSLRNQQFKKPLPLPPQSSSVTLELEHDQSGIPIIITEEENLDDVPKLVIPDKCDDDESSSQEM
ncbi:hypothetical protein BY996DRAFT_6568376 [Phakopsora pachyrhizi]|nr:hypothetical protein BY996DRAFT_6568376 [Phakopsora pachyrhizi]